MSADVAIVIVTYNSERQIEACLQSAFDERSHIKKQVIVLDNQSSDGTVELVRERFPTAILITPERNLGFAAGVNRATCDADAEFILLLNPDTVIKDHAVERIVDFARRRPGHGLYGGRTLKDDGSLEPSSCWGLPSLWSLAMFAFGLSTIAKHNGILDPESMGRWQRDTVKEVGIITGCFLLVAKAVWKELGGFDERYFMYGEDADLAMRAHALGYRPVICPEAQLVHEVGKSSATPLHKALLLYKGKATFVRSHWKGWRRQLGLLLLATGVGLRALVGLAGLRTNNTWLGVWKERRDWLKGYQRKSDQEAKANGTSPTVSDRKLQKSPGYSTNA
jgi:GT2 family glycosyltransferase